MEWNGNYARTIYDTSWERLRTLVCAPDLQNCSYYWDGSLARGSDGCPLFIVNDTNVRKKLQAVWASFLYYSWYGENRFSIDYLSEVQTIFDFAQANGMVSYPAPIRDYLSLRFPRSHELQLLDVIRAAAATSSCLFEEDIQTHYWKLDSLVKKKMMTAGDSWYGDIDLSLLGFFSLPGKCDCDCDSISKVNWFYLDPENNEQGPFSNAQMRYWFDKGYFNINIPLRTSKASMCVPLYCLFPDCDQKPFTDAPRKMYGVKSNCWIAQHSVITSILGSMSIVGEFDNASFESFVRYYKTASQGSEVKNGDIVSAEDIELMGEVAHLVLDADGFGAESKYGSSANNGYASVSEAVSSEREERTKRIDDFSQKDIVYSECEAELRSPSPADFIASAVANSGYMTSKGKLQQVEHVRRRPAAPEVVATYKTSCPPVDIRRIEAKQCVSRDTVKEGDRNVNISSTHTYSCNGSVSKAPSAQNDADQASKTWARWTTTPRADPVKINGPSLAESKSMEGSKPVVTAARKVRRDACSLSINVPPSSNPMSWNRVVSQSIKAPGDTKYSMERSLSYSQNGHHHVSAEAPPANPIVDKELTADEKTAPMNMSTITVETVQDCLRLSKEYGISMDEEFVSILASLDSSNSIYDMLVDNVCVPAAKLQFFCDKFYDLVGNPFMPTKKSSSRNRKLAGSLYN